MRPRHYDKTPVAASATSIAALQTLAAAGSLSLSGTYGSSGFDWFAYRVTLTSANNLSGVTFTIAYEDADGIARTATTAGPNATTLSTSIYAKRVTSISTDGAAAAVSVGNGFAAYGPWKVLPFRSGYQASGVGVTVTGTANAGIEFTYANVADLSIISGTFDAFDHPSLQSITSSAYGSLDERVVGVRLKVNSYTSGSVRYDLAVAAVG